MMIRRARINNPALVVVIPIGAVTGVMLYLAGARRMLLLLAVITVLLCLHLPRDSVATDDGAAAGPTQTTLLPMQQPGTTTTPSIAVALPREPPAAGLRGRLGGASAFVVAVLPVYVWEKKAGDGDECAICLGEVQRGQVVKQLPACTHVFHARCIDRWLTSQVTCPVCRTPVDSAAVLQLQAAGVGDQLPQ